MDAVVTVDGSCNCWGKMGIGYVIRDKSAETVVDQGNRYLAQRGTSNIAEYRAIAYGCTQARELGASRITVYTDSQLAFRQLGKLYRVKNTRLVAEYKRTVKLLKELKVKLCWHSREDGDGPAADKLAKEAWCGKY